MSQNILICTDLDRTLIPNGTQPESLYARAYFSRLAGRDNVDIAYVTGRNESLILEAIKLYQLPIPKFVIADVGSNIYIIEDNKWRPRQDWQNEIAPYWNGLKHSQLAELFTDIDILKLQEQEKQNDFKLSFYAPLDCNVDMLSSEMQVRLKKCGVHVNLVWSVDDIQQIGLMDVLPKNATKLHAIEFLMQQQGYQLENTLFAGDSGNDLLVLASNINAVLVANASNDIRQQAIQMSAENHNEKHLYIAKGNFRGMNGNYAAGILEGLNNFIPSIRPWLTKMVA